MSQPDLAKEFPPSLSEAAAGKVRLLECVFSPLLDETTKQRPQTWAQRDFGYAFFLTFRAQPDNITGEIHVAKRNDRFGKTAALFPRDFIRDAHPFRFELQRSGDEVMFVIGDARLSLGLITSNVHAETLITLCKSRCDRFIHDEAQELYFEERGVFCAFVCAAFSARLLAPLDEVSYLLPCKLPGNRDADGNEIRIDVVPGLNRPLSSRSLAVALRQEPGNPGLPYFGTGAGRRFRRDFPGREIVAQLSRFARSLRHIVSQFRRSLSPGASRVDVLNPPKRRSVALVK